MLSPPNRMWSPTATRFSAKSPFSSETVIRLKSVVPPPTSQTRTKSPTLMRFRHPYGTRIMRRTEKATPWQNRTFCSPCLPRLTRKREN